LRENNRFNAAKAILPTRSISIVYRTSIASLANSDYAARAKQFAGKPHLIIICGHYEGVDERVREALVDEEVSIGDYVLTNGALAAMVLIDAVARFIPGVLGEEKSLTHESFTSKLLDFPQYTRPAEFRGMSVPEVLLSGNHAEIEKWRIARQEEKTRLVRPDLLK